MSIPQPPAEEKKNTKELSSDVYFMHLADRIASFENTLRSAIDTIAAHGRLLIDVETSIKKFQNEQREVRSLRETLEKEQLEADAIAIAKKLEANNARKNQTTEEQIELQVEKALKNKRIPWEQIGREKVLPAVLTTLAIALTLGALSVILPGILEALRRAYGGG